MVRESQKLIETISATRDDDLLRMVYLESDQYRPEVLTYAKAEIRQRGITFEQNARINVATPRPDLWLAACGERIWRARRTIAFGIGFVGGLAYFAWANFKSYQEMYQAHCDDCFVFFGFPFDLYQTGGFAGPTTFLWGGLIVDVAIAAIVSASVGWFLKVLISKTTH